VDEVLYMNIAINIALVINLISLVVLLLVDHLFLDLWPIAVLICIWMIFNLFIFTPLVIISMFVEKIRRQLEIHIFIFNLVATAILAILINFSKSVDALMSV